MVCSPDLVAQFVEIHCDHIFLQVSLDPTAAVAFLALPAFKESAVLEAAQGYRVIQVSGLLVIVF